MAFQIESQITTHLLPGDYRVVASRGYSWEIAEMTISVAPGTSQTLDFELEKAVDDRGWVAADLHLHAFWSPDSEVPYPVRLRQAAANDVSLPVFTEHTYMGPLAPSLAESGVAFDRIAVLLRAPEEYRPHLVEAFGRAGIPAHFARGTVQPDPAGRAFLALLGDPARREALRDLLQGDVFERDAAPGLEALRGELARIGVETGPG